MTSADSAEYAREIIIEMRNAMLADAATNGLLAGYVLATAQWSAWG
jgi:hypothetical protein